jgi:hypothetical protein
VAIVVAPTVPEYVPDAQNIHGVLAPTVPEYVPAAQDVHVD